jgi:hypothetical protein
MKLVDEIGTHVLCHILFLNNIRDAMKNLLPIEGNDPTTIDGLNRASDLIYRFTCIKLSLLFKNAYYLRKFSLLMLL